jgi:hypothetical protein
MKVTLQNGLPVYVPFTDKLKTLTVKSITFKQGKISDEPIYARIVNEFISPIESGSHGTAYNLNSLIGQKINLNDYLNNYGYSHTKVSEFFFYSTKIDGCKIELDIEID